MMIKDREKVLFEEWKRKRNYQYFITDGVFDEDEWNKQSIKILFVLKEAHLQNKTVCESNLLIVLFS